MLDDPATAHLVPPLAAHLKSAPSAASGFALIGGCILAATLGVGLITYGALARAGRCRRSTMLRATISPARS